MNFELDHMKLPCMTVVEPVLVSRVRRPLLETFHREDGGRLLEQRHARHPIPATPHRYARVHAPTVCMRAGVIGHEGIITLPTMKMTFISFIIAQA